MTIKILILTFKVFQLFKDMFVWLTHLSEMPSSPTIKQNSDISFPHHSCFIFFTKTNYSSWVFFLKTQFVDFCYVSRLLFQDACVRFPPVWENVQTVIWKKWEWKNVGWRGDNYALHLKVTDLSWILMNWWIPMEILSLVFKSLNLVGVVIARIMHCMVCTYAVNTKSQIIPGLRFIGECAKQVSNLSKVL